MSISLFNEGKHIKTNSQLKKYASVFGALFEGFTVLENNKQVPVPIRFANQPVRNSSNQPTTSPDTKLVVPAMNFRYGAIVSDSQRKPIKAATITSSNQHRINDTIYNKTALPPTPYDITFVLAVRASTVTQALLIYEQIESAFANKIVIKLVDDNDLDVVRNITIIKDSTLDIIDNYQDINETRVVEFEINFLLKGYLYNNIRDVPAIIEIKTNLFSNDWLRTKASDEDISDHLLKDSMENPDG